MQMYAELSDKLRKILGANISLISISLSMEAPENVELIKDRVRICESLNRVRSKGESFYITSKEHKCNSGSRICGLEELHEKIKTGDSFLRLGRFASKRAARRFLSSVTSIKVGTVKVISFSPLKEVKFEPDIVVLIGNAKQATMIADAFAYKSGKTITGLANIPICAAVIVVPYLSGEVVYSIGDFGGRRFMKAKDEDIFVGIPAELLYDIVENLENLERYREEAMKR